MSAVPNPSILVSGDWLTSHLKDEGLVIQSDGKIVIAGMVSNDLGLMRLTADGELDHDFGTGSGSATASGGMVVTTLSARSWPTATALADADRIVLAGGVDDGNGAVGVLVRYTKDGQADVTFGDRGVVMAPKDVGAWRDVAVARDGKMVGVSGSSVVRFTHDGALDLEFGDRGIATAEFPVSEVAIGPDGKIVVAGTVVEEGRWSFALARFLP